MSRGRHRKGRLPPEEIQASAEARAAHQEAEQYLREVKAKTPEVESIVNALRLIRTRNHFGEMVRNALDGRQ